ncbi:MAG: glycosyltransferase family 2 protein [Candidatus Saccharimonadales bacterium]|jgi:glycosyltransferase involved in cell wall biosynthesis
MRKSLSIVIPAYNEERHLPACLDAIAAQTVMPDEVIVVDNNSSDRTSQVAKRYPFVRLVHEKQQGRVYARNAGFNAARSDLIGRIDADTIMPIDWVEQLQQFYEDEDHFQHFAYTGGSDFYNIRLPKVGSWITAQMAFRLNRLLLGHYILYGANMAIPKHLWQAVRNDVCHRNDIHEDLDLSIHLHRLGFKVTYQVGLHVRVKMRRVRTDRSELKENLMWWPQTLKVHHNNSWVIGWVGAELLFYGSLLLPVIERVAQLFGRDPLPE